MTTSTELAAMHQDAKGKVWGIRFSVDNYPTYFKVTEAGAVRTKSTNLPTGVKEILRAAAAAPQTVAEPTPEVAPLNKDKVCIFCGEYADSGKFINQWFRPLCKDDYQRRTTGQVVARLREMDDTTSTDKQ